MESNGAETYFRQSLVTSKRRVSMEWCFSNE